MTDQLNNDISKTLDCSCELLPLIPALLTDLWALGSSPDAVLGMLEPLGLPEKTRVIDLGCGKGAVSVAVAKRLGFQCEGVDGIAAFIEEASGKAKMFKVDSLCTFKQGDIRDKVTGKAHYDIALFCAIDGGIFGTWSDTVTAVRQLVKKGGYMIIDGGFLAGEAPVAHPGYEYCESYEATIAGLTSQGDRIVCEETFSSGSMQAEHEQMLWFLKRRVKALSKEHPKYEALLNGFLRRKKAASAILATEIVGGMWLLQKG